jgi:hypothetical protein
MSSPVTIVVDGHVYHVLPDLAQAPRRLTVTVRDDRGHEWTYDEPAWRPLGYGLTDRRFLLWSARRLIVFGEDRPEPELVESDEDILYVFSFEEAWLLVCETSVRLIKGGQMVARLELSDVVAGARLEDDRLIVTEADGREVQIQVTAARLIAA